MNIRQHFNLKSYNTMALDATAEYFCEVSTVDEIAEALAFARREQLPVKVLGGGSNVIMAARISGLVLRVLLPGIERQALEIDSTSHLVQVGAGENWHRLVCHCLANGSYGLENLSLIPGSCGAAPIQNIGAYGVELADIFHSLEAIDIATGELLTFTKTDCGFSYRNSVFKNAWRDRVVITALRLQLSSVPQVNIEYPALREALAQLNPAEITPQLVGRTVSAIRTERLPDPQRVPNVGSFFKNPIIDVAHAAAIRRRFPDLVTYPMAGGREKLAAAWLIDQAGWKGFRRGNVGVHDKHALVLINTAAADGEEVMTLAEEIIHSVVERYGVLLELEPQRL